MVAPSGAAASAGPGLPIRLSRAFRAFDVAGLDWCLLRPPASLRRAAGDVDILVDPGALDAVRTLMGQELFVEMPVPGPDLHAVDYDSESDRFLWLHVQTTVRLGRSTVPASAVLRALERDPLPRPADPWLLWILLLHGLLDKGGIAERHRALVSRLARSAPAPPAQLDAVARAHGVHARRVCELAAECKWTELAELGETAVGRRPPPLRDRIAGTVERVSTAWARRGIAVALIGPDGAGKTTLAQALRATLPFPVEIVYMGLTGGRLPKADALRIPGLVLCARLALLWTRYLVAVYHRARGRVVLFDRYVLDAGVPSGRALSALARLSRRVQGAACPAPDLVLLLDASGATLHRRSGEYDSRRLQSWADAYRRIARSRTAVEVLDAEQPADLVRRAATARIWECYRKRWGSARA